MGVKAKVPSVVCYLDKSISERRAADSGEEGAPRCRDGYRGESQDAVILMTLAYGALKWKECPTRGADTWRKAVVTLKAAAGDTVVRAAAADLAVASTIPVQAWC